MIRIIDTIRKVLHDNGFLYCPDLTVDFDSDKVQAVQKSRTRPVKLGGRPYREVKDSESDLSFELVQKYQKDKVQDLTEADLNVIGERNLDKSKAVIFKRYWYLGKTSKQTERLLKRDGYGYGYGYRTADKYFSAFSSALLTEKGIIPK